MASLRFKKRCQKTGKVRYRSKVDAVTALATASKHRAVQRAYHCTYCECWHLTSWARVNP